MWPFVLAGVILFCCVLEYAILYARAGRPWWAAFIPLYSTWVHANVIGRNPLLMVSFPFLVAGTAMLFSIIPFGFLIAQLAPNVITIYSWIILWDLAIVFNASTAVAIVTVFLPYIGPLFIIFNKNPYVGPLTSSERRVLMRQPWVDYGLVRPGAQVDQYGNPLNPLASAYTSYTPTTAQGNYPHGQVVMSDWTLSAHQTTHRQSPPEHTAAPGTQAVPSNAGQPQATSTSLFASSTPEQEANMWAQPSMPPSSEPSVPNLDPSPPKVENNENSLPPFTP